MQVQPIKIKFSFKQYYVKKISSFGAKAAFFGAIGLKKPD
jgi:hypothetical protein